MSGKLHVQRLARSGLSSIGDVELLLRAYLMEDTRADMIDRNLEAIAKNVDWLRNEDRGRGRDMPELLGAFTDLPSQSRTLVAWLRDVLLGLTTPSDVFEVADKLALVRADPESYARTGDVDAILDETDSHGSFEALVHAYISGSIVPFVGAGLSFASGFPTWRAFLIDAATRRGVNAEVETLLDHRQYEKAAQRVRDAWEYAAFRSLMRETFARDVEPAGAVLRLPALTQGLLVTTNYDRVLEEVYRRAAKPLAVIAGALEDAVREAFHATVHRTLWKVHGDAGEITNQVLTTEQYEQQYRSAGARLPPLLRTLFVNSQVLFIGCSLADATLLETLPDLREVRPRDHFALLEQPASDAHEWRAELSARGVQVIYYRTGRHGDIDILLQALIRRCGGRMRLSKRMLEAVRALEAKLDAPAEAMSDLDEHTADLIRSRTTLDVMQAELEYGEQRVRGAIESLKNELDTCRAVILDERPAGTLLALIDAAREALVSATDLKTFRRATKELRQTVRRILRLQ